MTTEEIFKNFIEDPLLIEKGYLSEEEIEEIKLVDKSRIKLIEVIRMSIIEIVDGSGERTTLNKINQYLNM